MKFQWNAHITLNEIPIKFHIITFKCNQKILSPFIFFSVSNTAKRFMNQTKSAISCLLSKKKKNLLSSFVHCNSLQTTYFRQKKEGRR